MATVTKKPVTLDGSEFWFENVLAEQTWISATATPSTNANGTLVAIAATGLENGQIIEIRNGGGLDGYRIVTNQNGETQLNEFLIADVKVSALGGAASVDCEIRIVEMSKSCDITGGSWNHGSVNTNSQPTPCGVRVLSTSKEKGTLSFNFLTDFNDEIQYNLYKTFAKDFQRAIACKLKPANNNIAFLFVVNITGMNVSFDENFTSDCSLQLLEEPVDVYIADETDNTTNNGGN